jgi:hypothetical protein
VPDRLKASFTPGLLISCLLVSALLPLAALAQTPPAPTLVLNPASGAPGASINATGANWPAAGEVILYLDTAITGPELRRVTPVAGSFDTTFPVPPASMGAHSVRACIRSSAAPTCVAEATARLSILAPAPPPPGPTAPPPPPPSPIESIAPAPTTPAGRTPRPGATTPGLPLANPTPTGDLPPPATDLPVGAATTPPAPPPLAIPEQDFPDLFLRAMEITQGIQDLKNRMPLVDGRRTWVRVYPAHSQGGNWGPVDGAMLLEKGGDDLVIYPENGPITAENKLQDRTKVDASLNFLVPTGWNSGQVKFTALIWAFSPSTLEDKEPNPDNNRESLTRTFQETEEPVVNMVALDDGTGVGPTPTLSSTIAAAVYAYTDLLTFLPLSNPPFIVETNALGPGPEASEPGEWTLLTTATKDEPIARMNWLHAQNTLPEEENVFGVFDNGVPSGTTQGWARSLSAWTKSNEGTPAHEFGHQGGLGHTGCKDTVNNVTGDPPADGVADEILGGGLDITHPNALPKCSIAPTDKEGYFGLTNYSDYPFQVYSNDPTHPAIAFPFMSYSNPDWTDAYHYCRLLNSYGVPCSGATTGIHPKNPPTDPADCTPKKNGPYTLDLCLGSDLPNNDQANGLGLKKGAPNLPALALPEEEPESWLLLTGKIGSVTGTGSIGQAKIVDSIGGSIKRDYDEHLEATRTGLRSTNAMVRVLDSDANLMAAIPVPLDEPSAHGLDESNDRSGAWLLPVPLPEGATVVELAIDGKPIANRTLSETAPTVQIQSATAAGRAVTIRWAGTDADADPLTYTVSWSNDGEAWRVVQLDVSGTSATIDDPALPGGDVKIRVEANDGARTGRAESETIVVPQAAPRVFITGAALNQEFARFAPVELVAQAHDPEDGFLDGDGIAWSSSVDGDLDGARTLITRELSVGDHVIKAVATDSDGSTSEATLPIKVVDRGRPEPRADGAEPLAEMMLRAVVPEEEESGGVPAGLIIGVVIVALLGIAAVVLVRRRKPGEPS